MNNPSSAPDRIAASDAGDLSALHALVVTCLLTADLFDNPLPQCGQEIAPLDRFCVAEWVTSAFPLMSLAAPPEGGRYMPLPKDPGMGSCDCTVSKAGGHVNVNAVPSGGMVVDVAETASAWKVERAGVGKVGVELIALTTEAKNSARARSSSSVPLV